MSSQDGQVTEQGGISFVRASIFLRPPRVAVVVPSDQRWRDWAMEAMFTASNTWGGVGFILVPYNVTTGDVPEIFAPLVRAYDPDHVVNLVLPTTMYDQIYPGVIRVSGNPDPEDRRRLLEATPWPVINDEQAKKARERVAKWCSPMRVSRTPNSKKAPSEQLRTIHNPAENSRSSNVLRLAPQRQGIATLSASRHWRSDAALFAAVRLGVVDDPQRSENLQDCLTWLVAPDYSPAPSTLHTGGAVKDKKAEPHRVAHFLGSQRLSSIRRGHSDAGAVIVYGDTFEDLCLAIIYDRMLGQSVWLTAAAMQQQSPERKSLRSQLQYLHLNLELQGQNLFITSASEQSGSLHSFASVLEINDSIDSEIDGVDIEVNKKIAAIVGRPSMDSGLQSFVVEEPVGLAITIPVTSSVDGSRSALTGIESPIPKTLLYGDKSGKVPYWYVDVDLHEAVA